jgi:thiamine biosynthesis lipoprotein
MKNILKRLTGAVLLLIIFSSNTIKPENTYKLHISNYENVLGTSMEIKIVAKTDNNANNAEKTALAEIDRLNKILSGYDATSEFSRWMKAGKKETAVSTELYDVLSLFDKWRVKSNGALDASAETISKVWRDAEKSNRLPSSAEINNAVNIVQQQHYILNEQNHTVLRTSNAPLILNSFAKSYIMNKAAGVAISMTGVSGLVINIGGDVLVRGTHTEKIQISNPKADAENDAPIGQIQVTNKTVATSGNYRRGEQINGKWYSHIVDPRTGQPATGIISSTVIANNATDAGALATALNVLSPEDGAKLAATIPGAEYMMITTSGKQIESDGWKSIEVADHKSEITPTNYTLKDKLWDPNYELAVNIELANLQGFRSRRPYVAIWVVDGDKKPVRQIALWYNKDRYLHEMRSWYSAYYAASMSGNDNLTSSTSATRSAGKYTLKWDGKDDKGNLVKQGTYTVYIEAAREHGTYQLITQAITPDNPQHFDMAGGTEISSLSLDYRKKADPNK